MKSEELRFSDLIREARRAIGLSQVALVEHLKGDLPLSQGTLSAWETGRMLPETSRSEKLKALSNVLGIPHSDFMAALREQTELQERRREQVEANRGRAQSLSVHRLSKGLVGQVQDYLEEVGTEGTTIWILGADPSDYFSDSRALEKTAFNCSKGARYQLVSFLDRMSLRQFATLGEQLLALNKSLDAPLADEPAALHHYAVPLAPETIASETPHPDQSWIFQNYTRLVAEDGWDSLHVHPLEDTLFDGPSGAAARQLLSGVLQLASFMVLIIPRDWHPPAAAIRLADLRTSPKDEQGSAFDYWLPDETARLLAHTAEHLSRPAHTPFEKPKTAL